jgi:gas vesicle protein
LIDTCSTTRLALTGQEDRSVSLMNTDTQGQRHYAFVCGLATGTFIGAGLVMWLAPRSVSELRQRMTASAKDLGARASERYQEASGRVSEAVDDITRKGQQVRDEMVGAVARGAHEVERYATGARDDHGVETRTDSRKVTS